jgi:hypothetical protein
MSKNRGLSAQEHVEVGALMKEVRTDLLILARKVRCYGKLSQQFVDLADALPTGWLETRLVELVGADGEVDGISVRDIYRGVMEAAE